MDIESVIVETVRGPLEVPARDQYITPLLQETGTYSEGEAQLYQALLDPGSVALDIGANVGVMTIAMADAVGPTGRVLAFEPQLGIHAMLSRNVATRPWVETQCLVVGSERVTVRIANPTRVGPERSFNYGAVAAGKRLRAELGDMVETEAITVDALALERCDFIKIDVEGAEPKVMAGAWGTIERCRPALSIEIDRLDVEVSWADRLLGLGYRLVGASVPLDHRQPNGGRGRFVSLMAIAIPERLSKRPVPKINASFRHLPDTQAVTSFSARMAGRTGG
jgi:FkbM family methyltransferase